MNRDEIVRSSDYWFEHAQNELYAQVAEYLEKEGISQNDFARKLGVSKGYVSQILNGNFNYTLKKLIELSLAIGKAPSIQYEDVDEMIVNDELKVKLLKERLESGKSRKTSPDSRKNSPAPKSSSKRAMKTHAKLVRKK